MILQRPKAPSWLLRFQALIPGRRQQVHTLLLHMQNAPGLAFYLEADTLAWWRDYVSRPRPEQALAFAPIAWLLVFAWLTAAQSRLVPLLADALAAVPLGLGAAFAYWFVARRRPPAAARPHFLGLADWVGATSPLTIPLAALILPLSPWSMAVLATFVALVLCLQDYALTVRPPQSTQRFNLGSYFAPILSGLLLSVNVPGRAGLAWGLVVAGMLIGWYRGRYTLPVRLIRIPAVARRLSFPFVFAAALGLSWVVVHAAGQEAGYPLFLAVALGWVLLRIFAMADSNENIRRGIAYAAGLILVVFWVAMTPVPMPVSVVPPTVPMADQPVRFESPNSPPPILWAGEREPQCPTLSQDRKDRPGAVGPQPCGTMRQWFRDTEYPPEAWDHQKSGLTRVRGTIGTDGSVSDCVILRGSGSLSLDETTCRLVEERARFMPARDAKGHPVPSRFVGGVDWRLPELRPDAPTP
jgi:protein TonB